MGEKQYIYYSEKDEEASTGLARQEKIFDPVTFRHLETIGVTKGWKCLEVGTGAGSVALWLCSRVGARGKVVATDIDERLLSRIAAPNLETRRHNILVDELEKGFFDLVHCRKVLHHLSEPEKAAKKMADALRPGGWLLIEEDDYGSMLSADVTDPSAASFVAALKAWNESLRMKGAVDYYFGRRVRGLVETLGFLDVDQEGYTFMVRGGDPWAVHAEAAWHKVRESLVPKGLLTKEQYEILDQQFKRLNEPGFNYPCLTLFCAWGRKPAQGGAT